MPHTHRHTLARAFEAHGVGIHNGRPVTLRALPAPVGHGIVFERTDMARGRNTIPALWTHAVTASLRSQIVNAHGATVGTLEHLMAAFHACGITDARIALDADEVPILDGSSQPWVERIQKAGRHNLAIPAPRRRVVQAVEVHHGASWARLSPHPSTGLHLRVSIHFPDPAIGDQRYQGLLSPASFGRDLARARTFCMGADIRAMHRQNLGMGGNFERAVIFHQGKVLNPTGLRFRDEPVRHKALDAVGDLFLIGGFLDGVFEAHRPSHALTGALVRAAMASPHALVDSTRVLNPA